MKLEEVLPAMRAGRVAVDVEGDRFQIKHGMLCRQVPHSPNLWSNAGLLKADGWTLEPEPKVEWPKGSIQKALESKDPGSEARIIRRIWLDTIYGRAPLKVADININNISPLDLLALDWEVVP